MAADDGNSQTKSRILCPGTASFDLFAVLSGFFSFRDSLAGHHGGGASVLPSGLSGVDPLGRSISQDGRGVIRPHKEQPRIEMIELEDFFEDVLGKAIRGHGMSEGVLSFLTNVPPGKISGLTEGNFDETAARAIAPALGLDADCLVELAKRSWRPEAVELEGLRQFNSVFDPDPDDMMTVNSYLVWDPQTKDAALFDTGADAFPALAAIEELGLRLETLFFTHSHVDHIIARDKVLEAHPGIRVLINAREPVADATRFQAGDAFSIGTLRVSTRLTWGHSPAGTTYVVNGLRRPVAVVGDALFAQSMGGGVISFKDALATNRSEIFSLPDQTVVCPGHGPMTSVGEEKKHNPFFPEFK